MTETPDGVRGDIRELTLLFHISRILDESLDLREVLGPVLEVLRSRLGVRIGVLGLLNRETGEISIEAALGLSELQRERGRYRIGEGIIGRVIQNGQPVYVPDVAAEPLFLNRTGALDTGPTAGSRSPAYRSSSAIRWLARWPPAALRTPTLRKTSSGCCRSSRR